MNRNGFFFLCLVAISILFATEMVLAAGSTSSAAPPSVDDLLAQVKALQAQLNALQSGSSNGGGGHKVPVAVSHRLSGYMNEQGNSGNAGLYGRVLIRNLQTSVDFDPDRKVWWASVSMAGDFLDNPSIIPADIQFALDNPRHASSNRYLREMQQVQYEWGMGYESETIFGVSISATSWLDVQGGKGIGSPSSNTTIADLWSRTEGWLNLQNGVVTDKNMGIDTYLWSSPRPSWAHDWEAYASFSGAIIPEPATMVLLAVGSLLTLRRRR